MNKKRVWFLHSYNPSLSVSNEIFSSQFEWTSQRTDRLRRIEWRRRKGGKEKEETLQDEGAAEEKGQLLFLSYGNGNEVGHGARDNRGPQAG